MNARKRHRQKDDAHINKTRIERLVFEETAETVEMAEILSKDPAAEDKAIREKLEQNRKEAQAKSDQVRKKHLNLIFKR